MDEEIRLKIAGIHGLGEETEKTETETDARHFQKNGTHYFFYDETDKETGETIRTRMKYRNGVFEIARQDGYGVDFCFDEQRVQRTMYRTPAGNFSLEVNTTKLCFLEEEDHIEVLVEYVMNMEGDYRTEHKIRITACAKE